MAKKSGLVKRYTRRKKAKSNPSGGGSTYRKNPGPIMDMLEFVGPGFAAFAATRLGTRAAAVAFAKRWPQYAKHAGAAASLATLALAWLGAHRIKMLERFHTPIVVGSAIATAQTLIQTYLPQLGWIVADANPDIAQDGNQQVAITDANGNQQVMTPDDFEVADDNHWYDYNDARDPGPTYTKKRQAQNQQAATQQQQAAAQPAQAADDDSIFDVLEEEEMASQGWGAGLAQN